MKQRLLYLAAGVVATLVFHFAGLAWSVSTAIAFVGWPLVGTLVTLDDDLPGGWSNPDGNVTPPWRTAEFWGVIVLGLAISGTVTAVELGIRSRSGLQVGFAALCAAVLAFLLLRHDARQKQKPPIRP